jgi:hypothetical protein
MQAEKDAGRATRQHQYPDYHGGKKPAAAIAALL